MEFTRLAEQQVHDRVRDSTARVRRGEVPHPLILEVLRSHGVDIQRSLFPLLGELDTHLYNGTVVAQDRRVLEFVVDTADPGESTVDDVTAQLGPKDPKHPHSDPKDVITMSLLCIDHDGC